MKEDHVQTVDIKDTKESSPLKAKDLNRLVNNKIEKLEEQIVVVKTMAYFNVVVSIILALCMAVV